MIIDLGLIDYREAYRIQIGLVNQRRRGEIGDSLILAEHPPVYTIGRSGRIENLVKDIGINVLNTDRGGDITFHGPGQLVLYPIVNLRSHGLDLHEYMRLLESAAILFLEEYSVKAVRCSGRTGVWVDREKIASIGIAASHWITYHGMSVNLNVDLEYFSAIYPCGIKDISVTSLNRAIGRKVSMQDAKNKFVRIINSMIDFGDDRSACIKYESAVA